MQEKFDSQDFVRPYQDFKNKKKYQFGDNAPGSPPKIERQKKQPIIMKERKKITAEEISEIMREDHIGYFADHINVIPRSSAVMHKNSVAGNTSNFQTSQISHRKKAFGLDYFDMPMTQHTIKNSMPLSRMKYDNYPVDVNPSAPLNVTNVEDQHDKQSLSKITKDKVKLKDISAKFQFKLEEPKSVGSISTYLNPNIVKSSVLAPKTMNVAHDLSESEDSVQASRGSFLNPKVIKNAIESGKQVIKAHDISYTQDSMLASNKFLNPNFKTSSISSGKSIVAPHDLDGVRDAVFAQDSFLNPNLIKSSILIPKFVNTHHDLDTTKDAVFAAKNTYLNPNFKTSSIVSGQKLRMDHDLNDIKDAVKNDNFLNPNLIKTSVLAAKNLRVEHNLNETSRSVAASKDTFLNPNIVASVSSGKAVGVSHDLDDFDKVKTERNVPKHNLSSNPSSNNVEKYANREIKLKNKLTNFGEFTMEGSAPRYIANIN